MASAPRSLPESCQPADVTLPAGVALTMELLGLANTEGDSWTVTPASGWQPCVPAVHLSWQILNTNEVVFEVPEAAKLRG